MRTLYKAIICFIWVFSTFVIQVEAQSKSVARQWNEALLSAIRADLARPTVHARNLFHSSIAMYDAWAVYEDTASTFFLNHSFRHFYCAFKGISKPPNKKAAQEEAMSYAVYRLLRYRFKNSPGAEESLRTFQRLLVELGYDPSFTSTDYSSGSPAALGNYLAGQLIAFGLEDGSNESHQYGNSYYRPLNPALNPFMTGNPALEDPNHWQPLALRNFVDQSGNPSDGPPPFLSPEWGKVVPFALKEEDLNIYSKDGNKYWVYHDPGPPPMLSVDEGGRTSADYAWNFSLVSMWGSHLDPSDGVLMDISPASIGNIQNYPATAAEYKAFYQGRHGGHSGTGYSTNPYTGEPYPNQLIPRGDYTRVLAEFWADGPSSETPPGHWFTILNYVNSHFLLQKKMEGKGAVLDALEWDVKSYLAMGGALHDAAVAAWGIKGYYDYIRPVSAIRFMAALGQSSDPALPNYHLAGIPLVDGYIELVKSGDPLAELNGQNNINKIKLYTWRGPFYRENNESTRAGSGWILSGDWWPYQQPTFVTPPFAGYVSGHSTFSRAAAEVLSLLTGDEFFPGGLGEFPVWKDRFLEFEEGPGVNLVLQWAKYKDAADQCSLSRIWGGIHPPADDIPGRKMGIKIGRDAFAYAINYFNGQVPPEAEPANRQFIKLYPNPLVNARVLHVQPEPMLVDGEIKVINLRGQVVFTKAVQNNVEASFTVELPAHMSGMYMLLIERKEARSSQKFVIY